jgi:hypothetical protein
MGNLVPTTFFSEDWPGRAPTQILDFAAEVTGRIREFHIWLQQVGNNSLYLTVRRSGVLLLTGYSGTYRYLRPPLFSWADSLVGLDIPVTRGDPIDVRRVTNTFFRGPAEFLLITEEGV